MKYLVILAGSPRGGERTWGSLDKYVLKHLNADLAICTDIDIKSSYLINLAKYVWRTEKYDDFVNMKHREFEMRSAEDILWDVKFKLGGHRLMEFSYD